jgi:hypothetical protein
MKHLPPHLQGDLYESILGEYPTGINNNNIILDFTFNGVDDIFHMLKTFFYLLSQIFMISRLYHSISYRDNRIRNIPSKSILYDNHEILIAKSWSYTSLQNLNTTTNLYLPRNN